MQVGSHEQRPRALFLATQPEAHADKSNSALGPML